MCRRPQPANPQDSHPANGLETAGFWSLLTWSWVNSLLKHRGNIDGGKLWRLTVGDDTDTLSQRLVSSWRRNLDRAKATNAAPSLVWAFLSVFGVNYLVWGIPAWCKAACVLAQTQFLALLLDEIRKADVDYSEKSAYLYALGLILSGLGALLFHHIYFFHAWRAGMRWRMAATGLLYDKCLKLRLDALVETSAGRIINIAATDVERFQKMCQYITYLVLAPLEAIVIVWLLWREIDVAALAGIAVIVVFLVFQTAFSKIFGRLRHETAQITDERVRLTGQVVSGVRVLKMYGWEPPFLAKVEESRAREIKKITNASWLRGINEGMFVVAPTLIGGAAFLTYAALGDGYYLTPRKLFVSLSLFVLLQLDVAKFVQLGLESIAEVKISFQRIQQFLLLPEVNTDTPNPLQKSDADQNAVNVNSLSCYWTTADRSKDHAVLRDVSFSVASGSLAAVVGPVGAGKTSLLMALLRELTASQGSVQVFGKIAYISQSPWIITGSVRENIVFGLEFDEQRYSRVIEACALKKDFSLFANGDNEMIGERGINLSGGQRARIGLARACYADADVFLLDDPLSAVDARVGRELLEGCICGFLANKTRILVTHQLQYLRDADNIVILSHGKILLQGGFNDLSAALNSAAAVANTNQNNALGQALLDMFRDMGDDVEDSDTDVDGVSRRSRASTGGSTTSVLEAVQRARSLLMKRPTATRERSAPSTTASEPVATTDTPAAPPAAAAALIQAETMASGNVTLATYQRYWSAAGGVFMGLYILVLLMAGAAIMTFTGVWLAQWGNQTPAEQDNPYYARVYGALVAISTVVSLWRSVAFFLGAMKASKNLHDAAFSRVLRAPVSFFDSNPAGRILNRFSKDLGLIDDMLPNTFFDFASTTMLVIAAIILVMIVNPWVIISLPFLAVSFYFLRRYYMKTARVVKRLESTSRSPLYSLMNEVLGGLPVVRAFAMQHMMWRKYADASDENLRSYFAFLATSRWVGFRLDVICLVLLIVTAFASVGARGFSSPSLIGLVLSQIITLAGAFQWTVRQSAEVENQMVSVERVLEYTQLPIEDVDLTQDNNSAVVSMDTNTSIKQESWPRAGQIEFDNVYMRYRPDLPHVLQGVCCNIPAGQKVGVVGRTGAGKSTLLLALLRLVEPDRKKQRTDGVVVGGECCGIRIDGVDIAQVKLSKLRRSVSTIPQDPVLYSGTIRSNLDPFAMHTDEECCAALEKVQLLQFVQQHGGLNHAVAEGGSNLSVGQRQLMCLSRALLRNSKIILMDEATANVDADTDAAIQFAIRHAFRAATVITIAHRLNTIIDADAVLVMDQGKAVEFGHPHELLSRGGAFHSLVGETGPKTAAELATKAEQAYNDSHAGSTAS